MATFVSKSSAATMKMNQTRGMTNAPPAKRVEVKPAQAATSAAAPACASAPISHECITRRAREIWASGKGGSDLENWSQAEKELRAKR